jgi:hypothetical protein
MDGQALRQIKADITAHWHTYYNPYRRHIAHNVAA